MASGSHYINSDDDEFDESYNPDSDDDVSQHDFELTNSECANFQYENEGNELATRFSVEDANWHIALVEEAEGQFSGYISQSSCHSLNTGSDSDGVSYHRVNEFDRERHMDRPVLSIGLLFKSVSDLRMALKQYAIRNSFDMRFVKNHKSRITAVCSESSCEWWLHASVLPDGVSFQIKKLQDSHTCLNVNQAGNHMASVKWIIEKIQPRLKTNLNVNAKVLCLEVLREYGVDIPYVKMWRARDQALRKIHGGFEESYRMILSLHQTIMKFNPGSVVNYKVQNDGSFERFCVFFSASLQGFLNGCRPFIGLDGTFLKGKFKGVLLTAIALDANKQIFPLGIAAIEGETKGSWMWFLENLKRGIGENPFTFMSDRQKGLVEAVEFVFPMSYHRFCMRHLYANFQKYYKGELLWDLFWKASRAYTSFEYESAMTEIGQINPQAKEWIEKIPAEFWSRAFFPDCLPCNQNQNNFTECFNNLIMEARSMPICDMIEWIRVKLMVTMERRRSRCSTWDGVVCPNIKKMLADRREKCRSCDLFFAGDVEYEILERRVMVDDVRHNVNMGNRTCTCRQWQLDGVPCIHAMTAIARRREKYEDYCHVCYNVTTYKTCYELIIHPLPDKRMWEYSLTTPVLPPHDRRLPG